MDAADRARLADFWRTWHYSVLLAPLCLWFLARYGAYTWADAGDLVIHEAGHVFFRVLGPFMGLLGGTLMQLLVPFALALSFLRREYRPGVQICLIWLGQSCLNVAVYAADARRQVLPLLGGPHVLHDWHAILGQLGLLEWDAALSRAFIGLAVVLFLVALSAPRWLQGEPETEMA